MKVLGLGFSDSFIGVSMIRGTSAVSVNCRSIIQRVQGLLSDFDSVVGQHVHRECNFAADFLSHFAYKFQRRVYS